MMGALASSTSKLIGVCTSVALSVDGLDSALDGLVPLLEHVDFCYGVVDHSVGRKLRDVLQVVDWPSEYLQIL